MKAPSKRKHADWIAAYLSYTKYLEAPDQFHYWTAVSTVAGALGRKTWIDMINFHWTPNFYIVFVGPAGYVNKTTSISPGQKLLRQVPGANFGPKVLTWEYLIKRFCEVQRSIEVDKRLFPMAEINCFVGELGTFFDPTNRQLVDALVDLWDSPSGPWEKGTVGSGLSTIHTPWLNILACTTPDWIQRYMDSSMIGGGFMSRTIFIWGDSKRHMCAYPGFQKERKDTEKEESDLLADLVHISDLKGRYVLSPDAIEWGEEWYKNLWCGARPKNLTSPQFQSYFARKQTHLHKLAIVLAASQRDELVIQVPDLVRAEALLTTIEENLPLIVGLIGRNQASARNSELLSLITQAGTIPERDLWRLTMDSIGEYRFFKEALNALIMSGQVKSLTSKSENIIVSTAFAERARQEKLNAQKD